MSEWKDCQGRFLHFEYCAKLKCFPFPLFEYSKKKASRLTEEILKNLEEKK